MGSPRPGPLFAKGGWHRGPLSDGAARKLRSGGARQADAPHAALSAREHQVFTLLIQGRTVSEVAAELGLSLSTVSNHVAKIKEKLGARSLGEIVTYAHRAGLID